MLLQRTGSAGNEGGGGASAFGGRGWFGGTHKMDRPGSRKGPCENNTAGVKTEEMGSPDVVMRGRRS